MMLIKMMLLIVYVFVFFFSSRRRHTRYWRDWSSDVCSSDLAGRPVGLPAPSRLAPERGPSQGDRGLRPSDRPGDHRSLGLRAARSALPRAEDRKSVV